MQEIIETLRQFDRSVGWNMYETVKTRDERIDALYAQIVHCLGEFGELANLVKKCKRDNIWPIAEMREEVADVMIFLIKIANLLEADLKKEVLAKIKKNEERFSHFKITQ